MNVGKSNSPSMRAPGKGEVTRKDANHNGNRAERSAVHDADGMDFLGSAGVHERV